MDQTNQLHSSEMSIAKKAALNALAKAFREVLPANPVGEVVCFLNLDNGAVGAYFNIEVDQYSKILQPSEFLSRAKINAVGLSADEAAMIAASTLIDTYPAHYF